MLFIIAIFLGVAVVIHLKGIPGETHPNMKVR